MRPAGGQLEGHAGLDQLLEQRCGGPPPGVDVLDELLGDRRAALALSAGEVGRARRAAGPRTSMPGSVQKRWSSTETIALTMFGEICPQRVDRRCARRSEHADRLAGVVVQVRVDGVAELDRVLEPGQVRRDRGEHAEQRRDHSQHNERGDDEQQPQLANTRATRPLGTTAPRNAAPVCLSRAGTRAVVGRARSAGPWSASGRVWSSTLMRSNCLRPTGDGAEVWSFHTTVQALDVGWVSGVALPAGVSLVASAGELWGLCAPAVSIARRCQTHPRKRPRGCHATRSTACRRAAWRPSSSSGARCGSSSAIDPTAPDIHLGHHGRAAEAAGVPGCRPHRRADHRRRHRPRRRSRAVVRRPARC